MPPPNRETPPKRETPPNRRMRAAAESMADEQAGFCGCVCVCLPAPARSMLADDLAHLLGPAVFKMCRLFLYVVVRRACFWAASALVVKCSSVSRTPPLPLRRRQARLLLWAASALWPLPLPRPRPPRRFDRIRGAAHSRRRGSTAAAFDHNHGLTAAAFDHNHGLTAAAFDHDHVLTAAAFDHNRVSTAAAFDHNHVLTAAAGWP